MLQSNRLAVQSLKRSRIIRKSLFKAGNRLFVQSAHAKRNTFIIQHLNRFRVNCQSFIKTFDSFRIFAHLLKSKPFGIYSFP